MEIMKEEGNRWSELFAGSKTLSEIETSWHSHVEGEVLEAHFLPREDKIYSLKHQNWGLHIGSFLIAMGAIALLAVILAPGIW